MSTSQSSVNKPFDNQMDELRRYWPQANYETSAWGSHLIIVPTFKLRGYSHDICTVLFVVPAGYPAACPENFWIDIKGLKIMPPLPTIATYYEGEYDGEEEYETPLNTNEVNPIPGFPHWKDLTWWSWHLQDWNPNTGHLITYMHVIKNRLFPAR